MCFEGKDLSVPVLTFFNNKGGVGKTSLIYHLAWMFSHLEKKILIADIDPQANLTAAFLSEDDIYSIWNETDGSTFFQCLKPLAGVGDIKEPKLQTVAKNLYLLPGDVALSNFEDQLSDAWPRSNDTKNIFRPLRILSSFWQILQLAAQRINAEIILVDIGPNLGAINRSVLIATDYVIIPMGADLFSLQGLKNLGPTLKDWKIAWSERLDRWTKNVEKNDIPGLSLPEGKMQPLGYVCQQYGVRLDRPVRAYDKWVQKIPQVYRESVLGEDYPENVKQEDDQYCIAIIKHYRSLVPIAQEHRKPIFDLTVADGAIGSHAHAVTMAREDYKNLAQKIAQKISLPIEDRNTI
jgi:cellulose biosynthesis protein BcsQ